MKNKNIWLIPTNNISRLYLWEDILKIDNSGLSLGLLYQNIYITSGDKFVRDEYVTDGIEVIRASSKLVDAQGLVDRRDWKKIVLTTDTKLIEDGVQAIDNEFLEWFVKNPSCEEVEFKKESEFYRSGPLDLLGYNIVTYKITIPEKITRCCGRCNGVDDLCYSDMTCDNHKERGCEICYGKRIEYQITIPKDETLRKQFPANIEGSIEFNEMCKEDLSLTRVDILELMRRAYNAGYNQYNIVEAGLEGKDTEENVRWILTKYQNEKSANAKRKRNFYCGDKVDYDEQCLNQCDRCVDCTGVDYGYHDQN